MDDTRRQAVICVAGGANIDICGTVSEAVRLHDSNPGQITISFGGVGRNIAEVCAALGGSVRFVTAFSEDLFGRSLRESCEKLGIDCSFSAKAEGVPSSVYLALLDERHEMFAAVNDMRILDSLGSDTILQALADAGKEDILVVDGNLRAEVLDDLFEKKKCRIAADPVSTVKCGKFLPHLDRIDFFKPNQYEAQEMCGIRIHDEESAVQALRWFRNSGVSEIVISLAEKGIAAASEEGMFRIMHRPADVENVTGGGDTFTAAYVSARAGGNTPSEAAAFAAGAALAVITGTVKRPQITRSVIEAQMKKSEMEVRQL